MRHSAVYITDFLAKPEAHASHAESRTQKRTTNRSTKRNAEAPEGDICHTLLLKRSSSTTGRPIQIRGDDSKMNGTDDSFELQLAAPLLQRTGAHQQCQPTAHTRPSPTPPHTRSCSHRGPGVYATQPVPYRFDRVING